MGHAQKGVLQEGRGVTEKVREIQSLEKLSKALNVFEYLEESPKCLEKGFYRSLNRSPLKISKPLNIFRLPLSSQRP